MIAHHAPEYRGEPISREIPRYIITSSFALLSAPTNILAEITIQILNCFKNPKFREPINAKISILKSKNKKYEEEPTQLFFYILFVKSETHFEL